VEWMSRVFGKMWRNFLNNLVKSLELFLKLKKSLKIAEIMQTKAGLNDIRKNRNAFIYLRYICNTRVV
jgi:hypothetical protein